MTKILIIDGNSEDRAHLTEVVRRAGGFSVDAFSSGEEGVAHFKEHGADGILLDYRLDAEDCMEVLSRLRSHSLSVPIILTTQQDSNSSAAVMTKVDNASLLPKSDLTVEMVSKALTDAIRKGQGYRKNTGAGPSLRNVLLVEDNEDDRENIKDMLLNTRHIGLVGAVATGTEALAYFENNKPDCVILDYRLETEDGLDILAQMKSQMPFTPVIMLTGQGNEEIAAKSIKVGASDYLIKQRLNKLYLRAAIDNAISRSALEARLADQEAEQRQFLSTLVHDLRAPLRGIGQFGKMAVEEAESGDLNEMRSLLSSQQDVALRAEELINTLANYALLDGEVTFAPVSLDDVVQAARDDLSTVIFDRQAQITVSDLPVIYGHAPQLTQLFQNLISNGLKYNKSATPRIDITTEEDGGNTIIVVKDNGIGIPEKYLKTIFSPLKRLWGPHEYEGTGLGLATCQKIVERHKGDIWCSSAEDEGSKFYFSLPNLAPN